MKTKWSMLLAIILLVVATPLAIAAKKQAGKPSLVVTDTAVVKATVEAVDYQKRTLTLKGPQGNTVTLKVDQSVKNFDQVRKGDEVAARYFESIAIYVEKAKGKPTAADMEIVEVAAPGQKPSGITVNTTEVSAIVQAIDYKKRTVSLKGPLGNVVTLKVDKSVKKFKEVKKGDEVVIRHTEALAISVEKP